MIRRPGIFAAGLLIALGTTQALGMSIDPTAQGSYANARITSSYCIDCNVKATLSSGLESAYANLGIGDHFTFDFFDIAVGGLWGTARVGISAGLALKSPEITASGYGYGGFKTFAYVVNGGHLKWVQPEAIELRDGSFLGVSFEELYEFGIGTTTTVSATIHRYAAAAVPEPETFALLVVGLLALCLAMRNRRPERQPLPVSAR